MGKPLGRQGRDGMPVGMTGQNAGTETSQYRGRKSKRELLSSGERTGACPNGGTITRLEAGSLRVGDGRTGDLQVIPRRVRDAV